MYVCSICSIIPILRKKQSSFVYCEKRSRVPQSKMTSQDNAERKERFQKSVKEMRELLGQKGNQPGWDVAWKQGLTPWETMLGVQVQPALRWACEQDDSISKMLPKNKGKVLIPGCGRGQDVIYFATKRGLNAIGIDISTTAVERAREYIEQQKEQAQESEKEAIQKHSQIVVADYLDPEAQSGPHKNALLQGADLVYDYTFFCALPHSLHNQWAQSHAAALKQGGLLFCVVYPLWPASSQEPAPGPNVGPPFIVRKEKYTELLQSQFKLEFEGVPPNLPEHAQGRQEIMIWRKK